MGNIAKTRPSTSYRQEWFSNLLGHSVDLRRTSEIFRDLYSAIFLKAETGRPLTKSTGLDYLILLCLALKGPLTRYGVSENLGIRTSSIAIPMRELAQAGLVRSTKEGRWRTGLTTRIFDITSLGLAIVVAVHHQGTSNQEGESIVALLPRRYEEARNKLGPSNDYFNRIVETHRKLPLYEYVFGRIGSEQGNEDQALSQFLNTGAVRLFSSLIDIAITASRRTNGMPTDMLDRAVGTPKADYILEDARALAYFEELARTEFAMSLFNCLLGSRDRAFRVGPYMTVHGFAKSDSALKAILAKDFQEEFRRGLETESKVLKFNGLMIEGIAGLSRGVPLAKVLDQVKKAMS